MMRLPSSISILTLFPLQLMAAEEKVASVPKLMDDNVSGNLLQTTLGLLAVLAIIAAAAWFIKRLGFVQTGAQGRMKIIGGVSLGTRERVVLLQVGKEQLVVGVAPGQIRTLHVMDEPLSLDEAGEKHQDSFASRLQSVLKGEAKQ
jgi:flagellar protein FliO/FliZ